MAHELLAGWGGTAPTAADVIHPAHPEEVAAILGAAPARGAIARGLGRSYGDAAQNAGGSVLATTRLRRVEWAEEATGLVRAAGGASMGDVLAFLLPRGRALPVVPGTRHVTVGGAVAADVHGKNHVTEASFARHVVELTLAAPAGVRRLTPADHSEAFWATAGGLGLTGVVLDATLRTVAVETSAVRVAHRRAAGLDELMAAMEAEEGAHRYAVAWLDALATGAAAGRGVLSCADHAAVADLSPARRASPLGLRPARTLRLPSWSTGGRMPASAVAALNRLRYRRGPAVESTTLESLDRFLFPLDAIEGWNRLYGRAGFVQYQFVVPFPAGDVVRTALDRLRDAGCPPFLAVLKRLGVADPGPLSFPMPGWTLAVDFPAARPGLAAVLDDLDESVAGAGGRVYLAKDARLRPELLGAMYPDLDRWRSARDRLDPEGVLTSDLGRRLGLVAPDRRRSGVR